ncbi:klaroid protein [Lutzomyia longipalpis]|nr:klaroid protein [Lutzomyia longipalpis]
MDTVSPPQTRSRSRSKTPFVPTIPDGNNAKDAEGDQRHVRKEPTVRTIQEEDESTQTPPKRSKRETTKSSNVSPTEATKTLSATTVKVTTTTTKVVTRGTTNSQSTTSSTQEASTAALKKDTVNQKEFNRGLEGSQKKISTPRNNKTSTLLGNLNGDLSDHIAYKEYRDAGEYWNKYPKTDYTYSKLSPHRREIVPGVIAMPNMSRKSLEKHEERVNQMVLNNPSQESYIRARYEATRFTRSAARPLHYDSGEDELDLSQYDRRKRTTTVYRETIFRRLYTRIITTIVTSWYWISRPFTSSTAKGYYASTDLSQTEKKSIFRRILSGIGSSFMYVFQRIYLLIASILVLDTWLLQSSVEGGRHKKKFLWFLVLLLPFLLFGTLSLYGDVEEKSRILPILPISFGWVPSVFTSAWSWTDHMPSLNFFTLLQSSSQRKSEEIASNIQQHLSAEEYSRLLSHIDQYIEAVVSRRDKEEASSDHLRLLIAKIVKENTVTYKYELTEGDIERIVAIVLQRLKATREAAPTIDQDLIDRITLSVREGFQGDAKKSSEEIVLRIIQSDHLTQLIDQRLRDLPAVVQVDTSKYDDLIAKLSLEVTKIREDLAARENHDQDINFSLESMRTQQEMLADQLYEFKRETDTKFDQLLNEIDVKIAALGDEQFTEINKQIRKVLVQIFNIDGKQVDVEDLRSWIRDVFVAKEYLEARLSEIQGQFSGHVSEEIQRSAGVIMENITEELKGEILSLIEARAALNQANTAQMDIGEENVKRIVREALAVYDADKTGLVDYALESAGGQILSTRCTESYHTKTAQISIFGIPLWYPSNTPRTAISPSVQPGNCWAFQGFPGFLVLKLNLPILVTGFTMEHIPKSLAPNGQIDSAPKGFSVWGLVDEEDQEPLLFGKYIFEDNERSLQYFPVQSEGITRPHQIVELRIESNHDNPNYTCLYRFRVHGIPQT